MKENKIYNTALYCRLSLDDGNVGESGSIQTQKIILEEYAKSHNFKIYDVYVDDGYSGLNFNRPGFQRMLQDIENGKVNLVITKDLSRLGRDYIMTGYYTEHYFKDVGVRYIAINDGIDTINDNNDIAPFKNILNDMYAKDLSRKVKAAKRSRNQRGLYTAAQVPYGYKKDPLDNNHLIVDKEVRPVIKLIYKLALQGHGCPKIARILTEKGIYTPGYYKRIKGDVRFARFKNKGWTYVTVRKILGDVVYLGHIESNKYEVINYKTKKCVPVPKERHLIVENTHEPIISQDDFDSVQSMIQARTHPWLHSHENLFKGIIHCAHCGNRMALVHQKRPYGTVSHTYKCTTYMRNKDYCPRPNTLLHRQIKEIVEKDIRELMSKINKEEFFNELLKRSKQNKKEIDIESKISKLEIRKDKLYQLTKKIYNDALNEIIDSDTSSKMIKEYQEEQKKIVNEIETLKNLQKEEESTIENYKLLKEKVNEFLEFKELNSLIVHSLISRIEVGYRDNPRTIKIYYKFIDDSISN